MRAAAEEDHGRVAAGKEAFTAFVSNLTFQTPIQAVKEVFADCGPIANARLVKDFKGRSKGFGFVVFENINDLSKALKKDRTRINGRPMFVSNYEPQKQGHEFKYSTGKEKDKLFVRGLPFSMTEADVKEAFEAHAPVKEIRLVTLRNGYSKGTCFIRFQDASTAERVRQATDQTQLREFTITVLISDPSAAKKSIQGSFANEPAITNAPPGTRRPTLAFKPRALSTKPAAAAASSSDAPPPTDVNGSSAPKSNDDFRKLFSK